MSDEDVKQKIVSLLAEILEVEEDEIQEDTHLVNDLGADSMAALEILANVEKTFGMTLSPDLLPRMSSLKEILFVIEEQK